MNDKIKPTERPCEVCHKDDLDCYVVVSTIGPMSFNTCTLCISLGAEIKGMEDVCGPYTTYNMMKDKYLDKDGKHIVIELKSGITFKTRFEYVEYIRRRGK